MAGRALSVATLGLAQTPNPFTASYVAPSECPTRQTLEAEISARLGRVDRTRRMHFNVRLFSTSAGYVARVDLIEPTDRQVAWQVVAPDCQQAVQGIALVCALPLSSQISSRKSGPRGEPLGAGAEAVGDSSSAVGLVLADANPHGQSLSLRWDCRGLPRLGSCVFCSVS